MGLVEETVMVTIQEKVDFSMYWVFWLFISLPQNSRWYCERCHENCYSMMGQANKEVSE